MGLFDQMHPFLNKFKAKPETADEVRDCKQPLSPKELLMVTGGPKTIDFGTVSVQTKVRTVSTRVVLVSTQLRRNSQVFLMAYLNHSAGDSQFHSDERNAVCVFS